MNTGRGAAAFIDLDSVTNAELNYVSRPEIFHLLPGAIASLHRLAKHDCTLAVQTNQAGIAKGMFSESD